MATINRYQTASGETLYRVRYYTPDRGETQKRGFKTEGDAERWANKVEVNKMTGEYVKPSRGRITVRELSGDWLARDRRIGRAPCRTGPTVDRRCSGASAIHVELSSPPLRRRWRIRYAGIGGAGASPSSTRRRCSNWAKRRA